MFSLRPSPILTPSLYIYSKPAILLSCCTSKKIEYQGSSMLYALLLTLFIINNIFLVLIILIQKGKGSIGLGGLGGGTQMLFGGSGGQDIFQKITWVLGTIFMVGALMLSLMRSAESKKFRYVMTKPITQQQATEPKESNAQ